MADVTPAQAMLVIAKEGGPSGAALYAAILDQQARDREASLPTWDEVDRTRKQAYERGFVHGHAAARAELTEKLFGYEEDVV